MKANVGLHSLKKNRKRKNPCDVNKKLHVVSYIRFYVDPSLLLGHDVFIITLIFIWKLDLIFVIFRVSKKRYVMNKNKYWIPIQHSKITFQANNFQKFQFYMSVWSVKRLCLCSAILFNTYIGNLLIFRSNIIFFAVLYRIHKPHITEVLNIMDKLN